MDTHRPLILPSNEELDVIKKELNEDAKRLENHVKLFKDWLNYQPHLPKNLDENLIVNYVRWCKYDLQKAKKKFELYVISRQKLTKFFKDTAIDEKEYALYDSSRTATFLPKLTKEGYRVFVVRFASPDPSRFDFLSSLKFARWCCEYLLLNDTNAGIAIFYDMGTFTTPLFAKMDLKLMADFVNLLVNVWPFRIKQIHFINAGSIAKPLILLLKTITSDKLNKRMIFHDKLEDVFKYIPQSLLPEEYSGQYSNLKQISTIWEKVLLEDDSFKEKVNRLKICGSIPEEKRSLFNLEEYGAEGSFRKLQID